MHLKAVALERTVLLTLNSALLIELCKYEQVQSAITSVVAAVTQCASLEALSSHWIFCKSPRASMDTIRTKLSLQVASPDDPVVRTNPESKASKYPLFKHEVVQT